MDEQQKIAFEKLSKEWAPSVRRDVKRNVDNVTPATPKEEVKKMLNEAVMPNEVRARLVELNSQPNISESEIEEARAFFDKEKARKHQQIWITRRRNALDKEEKEIRSNKTIKKLQKMLMIREIQRLRANL